MKNTLNHPKMEIAAENKTDVLSVYWTKVNTAIHQISKIL